MIKRIVYFYLSIVSASVVCFEIVATRISSVIFVNNYAFIILSLAILGLGCGGIFAFYMFKTELSDDKAHVIPIVLFLLGLSLIVFILAVTNLAWITKPFVYFMFLFLPFFFAGIFYARLFKIYATHSFSIYAADLVGAAAGSLAALGALALLGGTNAVLFLALIVFGCGVIFMPEMQKRNVLIPVYLCLLLIMAFLLINGQNGVVGKVPIGKFPEKDFYYVYPDAVNKSHITDSRWSIFGRADLVAYSHQDVVRQLFIDGAAGSPMLRFGGNTRHISPLLYNILIRYSNTIPLLFLQQHEKNTMLVIGPGGGKEVLTGLLNGVDEIVGVEINPDFVNIVKDQRDFDGGIYSDFPNINIYTMEGRHYVKQTESAFDLIIMALPSTEQLQNIENFASSENYLLTVEAIQDYLNILTPEGRLVFTVHNRWELLRLMVTTMNALAKSGISNQEAMNHFLILESDYAPTIVIKKNAFTRDEITHAREIIQKLPQDYPAITYLPYHWEEIDKTTLVNNFINVIQSKRVSLQDYVNNDRFNIAPCRDDSPYFYKVKKGIPDEITTLFYIVIAVNLVLVALPLILIKHKSRNIMLPLNFFSCIGLGFMIIEVSIFQKLVLYLGSPTISLSVLLSSLLVSMGVGSFYGNKIQAENPWKRIRLMSVLVVICGTLFFFISQLILSHLLHLDLFIRITITIALIFPFGFLLGVFFPTGIYILKSAKMDNYIPWMYGINGTMSVLGSILAVIFSMMSGFTVAFFIGIACYMLILLSTFQSIIK
ncbi:hypothetical protein JW960_08560 [candidate division KSB1 bacterium]|nr:hypothetical protein [candidate division KSB1 bacterium]